MSRAVKGLDHVVVMVDGIDAAERAYKRLGFQVQPRGFHTRLGTANHLMIFEHDYFEILGIVTPTEFNAGRGEWLKQGGGLANVALATDGADLAFDAFKAAGLQPDAPLFFDRAVEVDGKMEHAQFRTVRIPKTHMPVVGFFVCEHLTPQFVYRGEWAKHPNGARGILGVTVLAEQPAEWSAELQKYFGRGAVRGDGDDLVVDTGTQPDSPRGTVHLYRSEFLDEGICYEQFRLTNYGLTPVKFSLFFEFGADFADIFEVRGTQRHKKGRFQSTRVEGDKVARNYLGLDSVFRSTCVNFSPAPAALSDSSASYDVRLASKQESTVSVTVVCERSSAARHTLPYKEALTARNAQCQEELSGGCKIERRASRSTRGWRARRPIFAC